MGVGVEGDGPVRAKDQTLCTVMAMGTARLTSTAHVLLVRGMCAGEVLLPQWIKANLVQVRLLMPSMLFE